MSRGNFASVPAIFMSQHLSEMQGVWESYGEKRGAKHADGREDKPK